MRIRDLLYADDACILFDSKTALDHGANRIIHHLARFGLRAHYADGDTPTSASKTVAMRFQLGARSTRTITTVNTAVTTTTASGLTTTTTTSTTTTVPSTTPHNTRTTTNTSRTNGTVIRTRITTTTTSTDYPELDAPIKVHATTTGPITTTAGTIPFVSEFKYLGTWFNVYLDELTDIRARIRAGGHAFKQLAPVLRSTVLPYRTKGYVYCALMVPVLMWGGEHWAFKLDHIRRLSTFHQSCLRTTCGFSRSAQHRMHISKRSIMERLKVPLITAYIDKRTLTWLGKIARMDDDRVPKQLLCSWRDDTTRGQAARQANFGHRSRDLLVAVADDALGTDEVQDFAGVTEFAGSEFRLNGSDRYWKDYCGWITVAADEKRWTKLAAHFADLRSGMGPSMTTPGPNATGAPAPPAPAPEQAIGPPAVGLLLLVATPILTATLISWYYQH